MSKLWICEIQTAIAALLLGNLANLLGSLFSDLYVNGHFYPKDFNVY